MGTALRLVLILIVPLGIGCDLLGEDERERAEQISNLRASFGFRAIYGLNPEAAGGPDVVAALFYRDGEYHSAFHGERAVFEINGVPVDDDDFAFDYEPGKEYTFEASLDNESIQARITAPSVSDIHFTAMPDTVCDNRPVTISWDYLGSERNDGILMLTTNSYSSGHLDPGATSHTIPANRLWHGTQRVQIITIRSVVFRNLAWKEQESVRWDMGYTGSFITLFLMSEAQEVEVLSGYDQRCASSKDTV